MAIVKVAKGSQLYAEFASSCRDCIPSDVDDAHTGTDEEEDADSGLGSDCVDSVELEQDVGEFCQVGDQKFLVPLEVYELPDLRDILSIDTWNDCLTEDERFALSEFLPDMEQDTFWRTLKELFSGAIFHFGSPLDDLFGQMKGGLLEPGVSLYKEAFNFLERRKHYYFLHKYQNSLVSKLLQIKETWSSCAGYGIEERLRLLNIMRSQKVLMQENDEEMLTLQSETESLDREEPTDCLTSSAWSKTHKAKRLYAGQSNTDRNLLGTGHRGKPSIEFSSQVSGQFIESVKHGKQNPKGILKVVQKNLANKESIESGGYPSSVMDRVQSVDMKFRPRSSRLAPAQIDQSVGYEAVTGRRARSQISVDDPDEWDYQVPGQAYHNAGKGSAVSSTRFLKQGKKESLRKLGAEVDRISPPENEWPNDQGCRGGSKGVIRLQLSSKGKNMHNDTLMPHLDRSYALYSRDARKKVRHTEKQKKPLLEYQMDPMKDMIQQVGQVKMHGDMNYGGKGSRNDWVSGSPPFQQFPGDDVNRIQADDLVFDHPLNFNERGVKKNKKLKMGNNQVSKVNSNFDLKKKSSNRFTQLLNDTEEQASRGSLPYLSSGQGARTFWNINKKKHEGNGERYIDDLNGTTASDDDTDSSSSKHFDDEVETNIDLKRMGYDSHLPGVRLAPARLDSDPAKKSKLMGKVRKESLQVHGGVANSSLLEENPNERSQVPKLNIYSSRRKQKGKADKKLWSGSNDANYYHDPSSHGMLDDYNSAGMLANDSKETLASTRNGQMQPTLEALNDVHKVFIADKKRKTKNNKKHLSGPSRTDFQHSYESGNMEEDDSYGQSRSAKLLKRHQKGKIEDLDYGSHSPLNHESLQMPLFDNEPVKKKGKVETKYLKNRNEPDVVNDELTTISSLHQVEDAVIPKKRGKKTIGGETGPVRVVSPERSMSEKRITKDEYEAKLPKKSSNLIKPSVLTGFSFSIIHMLSAVRAALVIGAEESNKNGIAGRQKTEEEDQGKSDGFGPDMSITEVSGQRNLPSLSVQEIVNRVRLKPGDPSILKTQEPLQELVRGVLKIFSSKTAPLGAKGWKPLALYERASKSWSWVGPPMLHESTEVETSPEAWGISHKMLVKLVDSYASWLKNGQETLRQLGSLPAPPANLLPYLDEKERFRDLRAQKSLTTISPSSDEARAYFRKEEYLRYTVPDRAFAYTAADGRKSVVAPLRRCGGKPTSKARDHFMLKPDRPPHVTILCLVRDAAARLPGSIGTRADVCTLLRDSQYIVEDVSDAQVNQVVSGALDRLHYERDPCVQFDGERKLWVYLHREREDEDFEDDGTSSTKKWKRQKKEGIESTEVGTVADVGINGSADQIASGSAAGYELSPDINIESSPVYSGCKDELVYNDLRPHVEENVLPFIDVQQSMDSSPGSLHQNHRMGWEVLGPDSCH
ncbi:uncharacterized protein LOC116255664 [Nymphaea colorata]|uniref:uncharacterized protein LOC116255664 n=1 Tax=Nymphaea colorata TaxID=210225 RepID=UPI00129D9913|nr:uncharacterized protein LOC116255664 [Nymphaea colorata]XP_031487419.1 uncharacterized protein LOC116255664 [Nymphaea colorata]XP_031487420.1 uncharacterized protein LOC116255664 [Nymphaea colorata]